MEKGNVSLNVADEFKPQKIGSLKMMTSRALGEICLEEHFENDDSEIDDELLRDVAAFSSDEELDSVPPLQIKSSGESKTYSINRSYAQIKKLSVSDGKEVVLI